MAEQPGRWSVLLRLLTAALGTLSPFGSPRALRPVTVLLAPYPMTCGDGANWHRAPVHLAAAISSAADTRRVPRSGIATDNNHCTGCDERETDLPSCCRGPSYPYWCVILGTGPPLAR